MATSAALTLSACGSTADEDSPSGIDSTALPVTTATAPPPETAWEAIRDEIEGGEVDLQTALNAFALALGPVTGAEVPAGESGFQGSASGPLRWLRGHWDELTDEQRGEVEELLESYGAGGVALPGPQWAAPVSYLAAAAPLQGAVDDAVVNLEARRRRPLGGRVLPRPRSCSGVGSGGTGDHHRSARDSHPGSSP